MNEEQLLKAIGQMMDEKLEPIHDRLSRVEATLENQVLPAIQLLAEGQQNILEHIDEKITSRTEELEDRIDALEAITKNNTREIRKLKKSTVNKKGSSRQATPFFLTFF